MAVIEVRRLTKRYGERRAVDGLDLDVHSGEVLALLGPNGAGRRPRWRSWRDSGGRRGHRARLGIDPWRAPRQHRERVGVVLQEQLGQGELTVDELLRTTATYYRRPWDLDALLDAVGLPEQRGNASRCSPVGSVVGWTLRSACLGDPNCSSWTSPRPAWIPRRAAGCGD